MEINKCGFCTFKACLSKVLEDMSHCQEEDTKEDLEEDNISEETVDKKSMKRE